MEKELVFVLLVEDESLGVYGHPAFDGLIHKRAAIIIIIIKLVFMDEVSLTQDI